MRYILTITILLMLGGCCTPAHDNLIVGTPNDDVITAHLHDRFPDDTPIEVEEIVSYDGDKNLYLLREGHHPKFGCRISRTELELGESGYLFISLSGETELCIAEGCEHCDFNKDKGCSCVNSAKGCKHTVVKNKSLLRR